MNLAFSFALFSLVFAGMIDVIYKRYSSKQRSRGMFLCGMGVVWLLLQLLWLNWQSGMPTLDAVTVGYGLFAGACVAASNILLLEAMTHLDVSLGSTIYRLNTIAVILLSALFLGESMSLLKLCGIGCGVLGVMLLYQPGAQPRSMAIPLAFLLVAIAASFMRGAYSVVAKAGFSQGASVDGLMLMLPLCWIVGGLGYAALRERRLRMTWKKAAYSAVSGLLVFLIVIFLLAAIELGEVSVLVPIANLSFVVALLISVVLKMEALTARKLAAVGCAALSIGLLSQLA